MGADTTAKKKALRAKKQERKRKGIHTFSLQISETAWHL